MERWGNNKAIFMHKVANGEYLEKDLKLVRRKKIMIITQSIDCILEKPRKNF